MSLKVSSQIRAIRKGPATVVARERLLARVGADMSLQQPRPGERFAAEVTLARQGMGANVHFKCTKGRVDLRAVFTAE